MTRCFASFNSKMYTGGSKGIRFYRLLLRSFREAGKFSDQTPQNATDSPILLADTIAMQKKVVWKTHL